MEEGGFKSVHTETKMPSIASCSVSTVINLTVEKWLKSMSPGHVIVQEKIDGTNLSVFRPDESSGKKKIKFGCCFFFLFFNFLPQKKNVESCYSVVHERGHMFYNKLYKRE